jgi:hypothetical protein
MNNTPVPADSIEFRGLIGNKTWGNITGPEFFHALEKNRPDGSGEEVLLDNGDPGKRKDNHAAEAGYDL